MDTKALTKDVLLKTYREMEQARQDGLADRTRYLEFKFKEMNFILAAVDLCREMGG